MAGEEKPRGGSQCRAVRAVEDALHRRADRLAKRAGGIAHRSASGLEIGPQRYHDPDIWGPNYALREAPMGSGSFREAATMPDPPPTVDKRFCEAVHLLAELEPNPDEHRISESCVLCLAEILQRPHLYMQRCVDQVTFGTQGGQRWTRDLQIRIPTTASPDSVSWRVAPLGQFGRWHMPDFAARDCEGRRLNLLTRRQHALALTRTTLARQIDGLPADSHGQLNESVPRAEYEQLRAELLTFMTAVGGFADPTSEMTQVLLPYERLLSHLDLVDDATEQRLADLANQLAELLDSVPSFCWIRARPGEVLSLDVSYSTRDPKHNPAYDGLGPSPVAPGDSYASARADIYRDLGLGPIKHEFDAPSSRHVGSYSFMIEPPEKTSLMYLDWETGNSLDRDETVTCSLDGAHLPDDDHGIADPSAGARVRAFLRVSPHQRVQILAAAALNMVVVWLLRDGHVPGHFGDPIQGFILAAPSGLVAYLVSQQRHFYAYPLRRTRGILWLYLAISVIFLVAVALGEQEGGGSKALSPEASVVAWILFISSAGVFFWYLPLGFGFNWTVAFFTRRRWERDEKEKDEGKKGRYDRKWEAYVVMYQHYGRAVFYLAAIASLAALWFLICEWDTSPPEPRTPPQATHITSSKTRPLPSNDRLWLEHLIATSDYRIDKLEAEETATGEKNRHIATQRVIQERQCEDLEGRIATAKSTDDYLPEPCAAR